ncbi:MAG: CDGSH iron-sulfur domain-containing protein [Candidatus Hydrogenedentota bacterium]
MAEPIVYAKVPETLDLEPGKYFWCACGRSKNQPWCDGSHSGTGITPKMLEVTEPRKGTMCNCKATKSPPFCDGSHGKL